MARQPNLKIDGELLDIHIRRAEGDKFNQTKISQFILGKDKTYYSKTLLQGSISEECLERVCNYYDLDKTEYIITDEVEKKNIQQKADTQNYENIIVLLTAVDRTLVELLAQQKTTNEMMRNLLRELKADSKETKNEQTNKVL